MAAYRIFPTFDRETVVGTPARYITTIGHLGATIFFREASPETVAKHSNEKRTEKMGARGKKSVAELSVVALPERRPDPPADLTAEQAKIWRSIVETKPGDWFSPDNFPLLVAYVRAIAVSNGLAGSISTFNATDFDAFARYDKLLQMQERQQRLLASLATRMRLTQQSRFDRKKAAPNLPTGRPWDR